MNYSLLIVFLNESLPNRARKQSSNILFIIEVTGYIVFTFIEMYQKSYMHIYWLGLIYTSFTLIPTIFLKETLFYQQEAL